MMTSNEVLQSTRSRCGLQLRLGFLLVGTLTVHLEVLRKDLHFLQVHTALEFILEFHDLFQHGIVSRFLHPEFSSLGALE